MCFLQWETDATSDDEEGEVEQQFSSMQKLLTRGALERRRAYWKTWKHVHVDTLWMGECTAEGAYQLSETGFAG